jgi:transposase
MINQLLNTIRIERLDDVPLLLAQLQRMQVAILLDKYFPTHPHWTGELTFGEVACVWLAALVSTGDHRLCELESWAGQRLVMLAACLRKPVRALDFHDDRLADMLSALHHAGPWAAFEQELNAGLVRVYRLPTAVVRVDMTTASTFAAVGESGNDGLFQFGHSKDHRPDLAQIKVSVAALDPLGMPLTTTVVPGNSADDPLYVPAIQQVQASLGTGDGRLFVGDCKMAALTTRAYVASTQDHYLCPLSGTQMPAAALLELLEPVGTGSQALTPVYRPSADANVPADLIATGFSYVVSQAGTVAGKEVTWQEQRQVVRSEAHAKQQQQALDVKVAKAVAELQALNERKQGKKRLDAEGLVTASAQIVKRYGLAELVEVQLAMTTTAVVQRKYKERPAGVQGVAEHTVKVVVKTKAVEARKRLCGWRVYVTSALALTVAAAVQAYRGQYGIEHGFARTKGKTLHLTPLYLQWDDRVDGLVHLLSIGLRLLTLIEFAVRRRLQETGEKLRGVYPGQAGRATIRPSAELLLAAFRGVDMWVAEHGEVHYRRVSQLTPVQKQILQLLDLPLSIYQRLSEMYVGSG